MEFQKIFAFFAFLSLFVNLGFADSPQPKILLVLDAHWDPGRTNSSWGIANVAPYYIQALNSLGLKYSNCTVDDPTKNGPGYDIDGGCSETPQPHLKDFDIVIWFTGNDGRGTSVETLTDFDRNATKYFLDNGGKLFLTGQDIGYECYNLWSPACNNNPFYANYLHAYWCKDNSKDNTLWGEDDSKYTLKNNPIGAGYVKGLNEINISGGASNQLYPSTIFYREGNYVYWKKGVEFVYDYTTGGIWCDDGNRIDFSGVVDPYVGAIRNHTKGPLGYKVVYFAFGFEGITGEDNRNEIIKRILGYLRAPDTLGTKIYAEASQIEGVDYIDTSLTCDPTDTFCHRGLPKVNATCRDYQLFANVSGAEYYIDTPVIPERFAGNGTSLQAVDGSFNDNDVDEVVYGTVALQGIQSKYTFGTHYLYVHCNDTDGYWGKYDNYAFYVDRYYPLDVKLTIESGKRYTNKTKPLMEITYSDAKEDIYPHYMRFSCNTSVGWTPWIYISGSIGAKYPYTFTYSGFDITNTSVGCPAEDGNRTVCVQIRDQAGNWDDKESVNCSWIVLDRIAPQISSIIPNPEINPWLRSVDNVTIIFYDPILPDNVSGSGVHINYTSNGTTTQPLFNNTPFNPGWVNEGLNILDVWINDTVGNLNYTRYIFRVDNTPPTITWVTPTINSWTSLDLVDLTFEVTDTGSGVDNSTIEILPSGGTIINKDCTTVITNGYRCTAQWNTTGLADGTYTLTIKANDTLAFADNQATLDITLRIDKTPPSVTINYPPQFYNTTSSSNLLNVSVSDADSGVRTTSIFYIFENSTGQYNASGYPNVWTNVPLDPSGFYLTTWSAEAGLADGNYAIRIKANDTINVGPDNQNSSVFVNITIDNTPPTTTDSSDPAEPWYSSDQTITLSCTDNLVGCHVTLYCIYDDGTTPCIPAIAGTTVSVTCPAGSTCIKRIRYQSNDTLNNLEDIKTSYRIKIDKQPPSITIDSPLNGTVKSGLIDLLTTITDAGSGVNVTPTSFGWYEIRNASNLAQIFDSGLLLAPNFDAVWNSSEDIPATEWVVFNVSANDTLGWTTFNINVTFKVDNTLPSVIIYYPKKIYLNSSFYLDLRAKSPPGSANISFAIYNISNTTSVLKVNTTESLVDPAVGVPAFNFTDFVDISTWRDGNYTLNFSANNTNNLWATDFAWFAIDRVPPTTTDNSNSAEPWYSSDQTITLSCNDPLLDDGTIGSGCHVTLYCIYDDGTTPCIPAIAGTTVSVTCPAGSTCIKRIRYQSNDTLNNLEDIKTSYRIKIDKQPPTTTDNTTDLWYATNQTVLLSCSDVGSPATSGSGCNETLYCIDTAGICDPSLIPANITPKGGLKVNFTLEVGCPDNSVCKNYVRYRSNDTLGWLESTKTSRLVKIDKVKPSVLIEKPVEGFVTKIIEVRATITDEGSGVATAEYALSNSTWVSAWFSLTNVAGTNTWNASLDTTTIADGPYNLTIRATDVVGNVNDTQKVSIYIDNTPPLTWAYFTNLTLDSTYGDFRIYPKDAVIFIVNVSDIANVSHVILNVTKLGIETSFPLSLLTGDLKNGTWQLTYSLTDTIGLYNFTKLYTNDSLGNVFINLSVNIPFLVVNGSVKVALGETNEIDAGTNKKFNLTFNFNKTFEAPKISVYIPPNSPANTSQPPNYINQTPYTCYFGTTGCALAYGFDNQPYITWMNATGIGNNTSLSILAEKMKAATPVKDTNDWWISRFRGIDFSNLTKIKTPFLNITRILCDGNTTCVVYQNKAFNLTVEIQNAFIANEHTGNAYNVSASYESSIGSNTSFVNYTLASGSLQNVTWVLNITEAGNYTFTLKAWEFTKQYNATPRSVLIQVKDTVPPKIISSEWGADNIFNINETIDYYVTALDNVAIDKLWIVINQSNGNVENHTLTLYLGSPSYGKWKSTYANTSLVGSYSILGIYANDTEGNVGSLIPTGNLAWFEVRRLLINTTVAIQNLTIGSVQTIFANITGNASSITSITATIAKPRSYVETVDLALVNTSSDTYSIFIATGDYTNATRSGYYELNTTVKLASGINATASTSFSVFYGNVSIKADRDLIYLPVTLGRYNLTFYIIPDKGDLIGVNGSLFIDNTTVINLTSTLPQNQSFGDIYWEEWKSYPVKWEINTSNLGSTLVTLHVNSTTPSVPLDEQNKTKMINVTIIPEDKNPPIIIDFGHERDRINLFEPNRIWINATDNETIIDKVLVEINYTNGNKENLTAVKVLPEYYEAIFSSANASGNYSYRIYAIDVAGNAKVSESKYFSAYDTYYVKVYPDHSIYNKRETAIFRVEVENVNFEKVSGFNLTLVLNKNGTFETLFTDEITDEGRYTIKAEDPPEKDLPVTYWIYANVSKNGNRGFANNSFLVSKVLNLDFIYPPKGVTTHVDPGSPFNISIHLTNARGEIVEGAAAVAYCGVPECPIRTVGLTFDEATKNYVAFGIMRAPNITDFDFVVVGEAVKGGNRDPEPVDAVGLTTKFFAAAPPSVPPVAPAPPACECTDWEKIGCGLGGCKETEMFMMRSCKPAGCAPEKQCLELPECIIGDFEFNLQEIIEIPQGEDRKASGSLKNVGIVPLIVQLSIVEAENVSASLSTSTIDLPLKAEKPFDVLIHVPLTLKKDKEYSVKIAATSGNVTKLKSLKVKVTENPYIPKLSNLAKELEKLRVEIEEYERVGVDVKELKKLIESAKEKVEAGNRAIGEDNLSLLRKSVSEIEGIIGDVKFRLTALWLRKFLYENKWNIIILAIVLILSNYFVTQVALPYYKLGKEIKKLVEEEKSLVASRVEIEKQYFLRKIDEKTFFTLMADKQGKILRTRADITRKREERKKLLIAKLHPGAIAVWFKSNAIEFAIYLKNLPRKVYEKIKVKKIKVEKPKVPEVEVPKLPKAKILRELRYQVWKFKRKMPKIKLPSIKLPKVKVPKKVSREIKYRIWKIKRKIFRKIK
jgi:hypothetical protein